MKNSIILPGNSFLFHKLKEYLISSNIMGKKKSPGQDVPVTEILFCPEVQVVFRVDNFSEWEDDQPTLPIHVPGMPVCTRKTGSGIHRDDGMLLIRYEVAQLIVAM